MKQDDYDRQSDQDLDGHGTDEVRMAFHIPHAAKMLKQGANVLEVHYARNRRPRPPTPARLHLLNRHQQNRASRDGDESDDDTQHRQRHHSKTPRKGRCDDPTQLGYYPPKWTEFLEECKVETRTYAAVRDPWPRRREAITGFISEAIDMTVVKWRRDGRTVETGIYPRHRQDMCKLVRTLMPSSLCLANFISSMRTLLRGVVN